VVALPTRGGSQAHVVLQVVSGRAGPARAHRASGLNTSGRASTSFFRVGLNHAHLLKHRPSTALKHDGLSSGRAGPGPARNWLAVAVELPALPRRIWRRCRATAERCSSISAYRCRRPWPPCLRLSWRPHPSTRRSLQATAHAPPRQRTRGGEERPQRART
jgi:hypothetical protein